LPGLFHLCVPVSSGWPDSSRLAGLVSSDDFRGIAREASNHLHPKVDEADWARLLAIPGLRPIVVRRCALKGNVAAAVFPLVGESRPPALFGACRPVPPCRVRCWPTPVSSSRRIIMEKPFGTDLAMRQSLNASCRSLRREQIFRLVHFSRQGARRTSWRSLRQRSCSEPFMESNFIYHVAIDVPETLASATSGFYEGDRRVIATSLDPLFQIFAFVADGAPTALEPARSARENKAPPLSRYRPETSSAGNTRHRSEEASTPNRTQNPSSP